MRRQHLVVMLKEPHPGRVKTRLGRDMGMVGAAWWFRRQTTALLRRIEDPRWTLYESGEMSRRIWRWMRLPVSREIVKFATEGTKLGNRRDTPRIESTDAWEAVNVALGEPLDGALLHQPFDEVVDTVERLI